MLYGVLAAGAALIAVLVALDRREKRRMRERDARRDARQRDRIRDWTVMQWIFGNRAQLRITDERSREE